MRITGTTTFSQPILLGPGAGTFDTGAGIAATLAGPINGATDLTKIGTGTLILPNANTYSGSTTVSAGTLQIDNIDAVGTGLQLTLSGGTLRSTVSGSLTHVITFQSGTTSTLSAAAGTTLTLPFSMGMLGATAQFGSVTDTGIIEFAGTLVVGPGSTMLINGGTARDISGALTGFTLNAQTTTVAAGATLDFNDRPGAGVRSLHGAGTVLTGINPATELSIGEGNFSGSIQGAGRLIKTTVAGTNGTLILSGNNTYSGGTQIDAGTLQINSLAALSTGGVTLNGGTLRSTVTGGLANFFNFASGASSTLLAAAGTTLTLNGPTAMVGTTVQFGSVTGIEFNSGGGVFGPGSIMVVSGGTLRDINGSLSAHAKNAETTTVAAGATLDFNDAPSAGMRSLHGAGTVLTGVNPATVVTINDGNFSGSIQGAGNLTKTGTGTLILSGANTYNGGTTINAGTLQLGSGGTSGSIQGNVAVNGAGILAVNRSNLFTFNGAISGAGSFTQLGTGTTVLTAANTYTGVTTVNAGTLLVNGSIVLERLTVSAGGAIGGTGTLGR